MSGFLTVYDVFMIYFHMDGKKALFYKDKNPIRLCLYNIYITLYIIYMYILYALIELFISHGRHGRIRFKPYTISLLCRP